MLKETSKKIVTILKLEKIINEENHSGFNIVGILKNTLIFNQIMNYCNNSDSFISDAKYLLDDTLDHIHDPVCRAFVNDLFFTALVHTKESHKANFFQLGRSELSYYQVFLDAVIKYDYDITNDTLIKDELFTVLKSVHQIAKIYEDHGMVQYLENIIGE